MKLIALTGLPRSGKDTVANWLERRWGFTRLAFSDPLKAAASVLLSRPLWQMRGDCDFDREAILPEWGFSTRWFLQVLGTECMREQIDPDFWVKRMRSEICRLLTPVVITDCRFENEAAMVRDLEGSIVQIWRPGAMGSAHASDAGVISDFTIQNDGSLAELHAKLDDIYCHA